MVVLFYISALKTTARVVRTFPEKKDNLGINFENSNSGK